MNINYEIPEDLHRELKIVAATEGITLKIVVVRLLDLGLEAMRTGAEINWIPGDD